MTRYIEGIGPSPASSIKGKTVSYALEGNISENKQK
jgi:hypothetical protein